MSKAKQAVATQETQTHLQVVSPVDTIQQELLGSDSIIPRLLLMQGLSEFINERKKTPAGAPIAIGDMVNSVTLEVVAGPEQTTQIIPLKVTQHWRLEERIGKKFEYRKTEDRNAANDALPWDFKQDGTEWKRVKVLNVFALLVSDIAQFNASIKAAEASGELPDLNKSLMPVMISLKVYSYPAGKKICDFFRNLQRYPNARAYHYSLDLTSKQMTNDNGTFYIFEAGRTQKLDPAYVEEAARWYGLINGSNSFKVDETGESESEAPSRGPAAPSDEF